MPNAQALKGPSAPLQQVLGQPFRPYFDCQSMHRSSNLQGCQLVVDMAKPRKHRTRTQSFSQHSHRARAVRRRAPDLRVARHWRGRRGACICNKMQAGPGGRARWRAPGPGARVASMPDFTRAPAPRPAPPGAPRRAARLSSAGPPPRALGPAPGARPAPQHPRLGHAPGPNTLPSSTPPLPGAPGGGGGGGAEGMEPPPARRAEAGLGAARRRGGRGGPVPGRPGAGGGGLGGAAARGAGPVLRPALPGRPRTRTRCCASVTCTLAALKVVCVENGVVAPGATPYAAASPGAGSRQYFAVLSTLAACPGLLAQCPYSHPVTTPIQRPNPYMYAPVYPGSADVHRWPCVWRRQFNIRSPQPGAEVICPVQFAGALRPKLRV